MEQPEGGAARGQELPSTGWHALGCGLELPPKNNRRLGYFLNSPIHFNAFDLKEI